MSLTKDEFEARQLVAIGVSLAEYARDFVTVEDANGNFKTVRKENVAKYEQATQDDAERKQFEADMAEEVAAEMRAREAS
jgi:hypothetical protein